MVYVKRKDTFHIDSTDLYGEYNSFDAHDELLCKMYERTYIHSRVTKKGNPFELYCLMY